ncbi:MAG TPA: hypothetical protein VK543_06360 [Puia sp.]|nr:hypothetical protein [Puia sp.]
MFTRIKNNFQIKGIRVLSDDKLVRIIPPIFNEKIINDVILILLALFAVYKINDKSFYAIPIVFLFTILLVGLWIDFNPINKIEINLDTMIIQIKSRNIFKRSLESLSFKNKHSFGFKEITSIKVRDNESWKSYVRRYYVDLEINGNLKIIMIGLPKEEQAIHFKQFITYLLEHS